MRADQSQLGTTAQPTLYYVVYPHRCLRIASVGRSTDVQKGSGAAAGRM
jgi:hypothetical protein